MVFLALISGLLNLSSQIVFQKVVSMVVGDLYTTFVAVVLTFILGSALGSYFGSYFRKYLASIEIASGVFSFLVYLLLKGPFYDWDIPPGLLVAALFLPALALGTHIPLYSYYLRRLRFGWVYFLYHCGGIFGLLAVEWYFSHAGSVKSAVLTLSLLQLFLGAVIAILAVKKRFVLEGAPLRKGILKKFSRENVFEISPVFFAALVSFYGVFWAMKTQTLVTETFRLHATSISSAVFFWMAVAGLLSSIFRKVPLWFYFVSMGLSQIVIFSAFDHIATGLPDRYDGTILNYFFISFLMSVALTVPVVFSSGVFIRTTQDLRKKWEVDVASGILNLFASIGNILGFVMAALMASFFWRKEYFIVSVTLLGVFALAVAWRKAQFGLALLGAAVLAVLGIGSLKHDLTDRLFVNRNPQLLRACYRIVDTQVYSHPITTMALYTNLINPAGLSNVYCDNQTRRFYLIDGHLSHDILSSMELVVGMSGAQFFTESLRKSLVVGIGSGQAAWAVAAISKQTDLVEISPVVIQNLDILASYNHDLRHRKNVQFHLKDGFSYVRDCAPESYDLIFNTATYPSSFNASKLYSDEFVGHAKRCLSENGVYQTYFDGNSVQNMREFHEFLAPIFKHFRYVDVMLDPYPQVFAYDKLRKIEILNRADFVKQEDFDFINQRHPAEFKVLCRHFVRDVPRPVYDVKVNSLDRAYLEYNSIKNYVSTRLPTNSNLSFNEIYNGKIECY